MSITNILPKYDQWLKQANAGDADAQYRLGCALIEGLTHEGEAPKNPRAGEKWLLAAVDQGHEFAIFRLGELYKTGAAGVPPNPDESCVPPDPVKARDLWRILHAKNWSGQGPIGGHLRRLVKEQFIRAPDITRVGDGLTFAPDGAIIITEPSRPNRPGFEVTIHIRPLTQPSD